MTRSSPFQYRIEEAQVTYNLRFPDQYYDAETGLNQNYRRDYDPAVGRYVQSDPLGLRAGVNTYAYASDSPILHTDPTGLIKWTGDVQMLAGGYVGAGGIFNFDLKSACVNGSYVYMHIRAIGFGGGAGIDASLGAGHVEFEDNEMDLQPDGLGGRFRIFSAGVGVGVTYGKTSIQLGNAWSLPSSFKDPAMGIDASVMALAGWSHPWGIERKACDCQWNQWANQAAPR
jgi:RHS repeat-associated protein